MTTTIELSDAKIGRLQPLAERAGVSVEQYVQSVVDRLIDSLSDGAMIFHADDASFRAAMKATFRENEEIYRRLAK